MSALFAGALTGGLIVPMSLLVVRLSTIPGSTNAPSDFSWNWRDFGLRVARGLCDLCDRYRDCRSAWMGTTARAGQAPLASRGPLGSDVECCGRSHIHRHRPGSSQKPEHLALDWLGITWHVGVRWIGGRFRHLVDSLSTACALKFNRRILWPNRQKTSLEIVADRMDSRYTNIMP